jgi:uncharacterized protein YodC (DUF2158 family)
MANDDEIKAGDLVQLKSGGPCMTVSHVLKNMAVCVWFNGNQEKSLTVSTAALKPCDGRSAGPVLA